MRQSGSKTVYLTDSELEDRTTAEVSFYEFVRQAWNVVEPDQPFIDGWHVRAICAHLEALLERSPPFWNLMVNVPPGAMKSLLCSVFWPAWAWIHQPGLRFMYASYDQQLSTRDSTRCRTVLQSDWYRHFWSDRFSLTSDQNEKMRFENSERGWRIATSVAGRGLGEHPNVIVIDDPQNPKRTESAVERQTVIDWYDATISTRGALGGCRRVVIMQRLHEQDLCGHILETNGDDWTHLCLPMRYESGRMRQTALGWIDPRSSDGELMWPEAYPEQKVRRLERELGSARAAGQLQQRPTAIGGDVLRADWFAIIDVMPSQDVVARCRYWDKAGTRGGGAYTVGALVARTRENRFIIEDIVRRQVGYLDRERMILATAQQDAQRYGITVEQRVEVEPGSGGLESGQRTAAMLAGFMVSLDRVTQAKELRAGPLAAQAEAGNVVLLRAPWNVGFLDEAKVFPRGTYRDQVDAVGGALARLALAGLGDQIAGELLASGQPDDTDGAPISDAEIAALPDFLRDILTSSRDRD